MGKVLIAPDTPMAGRAYLLERGHELLLGTYGNLRELCLEADGCDAIMAKPGSYSKEVFDASDRLKILAIQGADAHHVDLAYARSRSIWVCHTPEASADCVVEHSLMLMLMCARQAGAWRSPVHLRQGFVQSKPRCVGVEGKTLGLIGAGPIGTMVARKAQAAFNMDVLAYAPGLRVTDPSYTLLSQRDEVLSQADFVSVHTACTPETVGSFDYHTFCKMKSTAFFINCSPGEIVNEAGLAQALLDGVIAGAALDSLCREPPDPAHPLLGMPNVIVTPHCREHSLEAVERMSVHAAQCIHKALGGAHPEWALTGPDPDRFASASEEPHHLERMSRT